MAGWPETSLGDCIMRLKTWMLVLVVCSCSIGCVVQQGMSVKRIAHYDASGRLTGFTVEETLALGPVGRPADDAVPVSLFEIGSTIDRQTANWPPRGVQSAPPQASKRHRR